jgi:RNA polymerase sigma-70 factor (ECF subfamily)
LGHQKSKLKSRYDIELNCETVELPDHISSIDIEIITKMIRDGIDTLPHQAKTILKMFYYDNLKTTKIASLLGMTEQAVRNNKTRAILLLRKKLLKKIKPHI